MLRLVAILSTVLLSSIPALAFEIRGTAGTVLQADPVAKFNEPWAMTFLPNGSLLVTEKSGKLFHVDIDGKKHKIKGIPHVAHGGQGGLGDVVLHPDFAKNKLVYMSYAKANKKKFGAVVIRAKLKLKKSGKGKLTAIETIWKQKPKLSGRGHYSHRIAFGMKNSPHDGKLFITSGDRQQQSPAQDMKSTLGKIIRLNDDGSVPKDNPWANGDAGKKARTFWTLGHRNMLGIAFDASGNLWAHEMGPRHGDELNLIKKGMNYGWPIVSEGNHYSGIPIPNHDTRPEFAPPKAYWVPTIAPSGLIIHSGKSLPDFKGNAFIGGLRSRALIRVELRGSTAKEIERFEWGKRIREVEEGSSGNIWVLEDRSGGRLLRLSR